jgi:hypothetical protein
MKRQGRSPIKETIRESNVEKALQSIINKSIVELQKMCENELIPDWMGDWVCDSIEIVESVKVIKSTRIKKLSNLPMFNLDVSIEYNSIFEYVDMSDVLNSLTDLIMKNYKIRLLFDIIDETNTNDRQFESVKPLIKKVLHEETEEDQKYFHKIKFELKDNYWRLRGKFEQKWLKDSEIQWVFYDEGRKIFEVEIKSNRNWDLTWWIQFDENMKMESVIRHEIKDWEYNIKDVEEIGGFEGYSKEFWSVIKYIYPYAQKFIIKKRKESLNENIGEPLKQLLHKLWDSKKSQGEPPRIKYTVLKKLGLLNRRNQIRDYYIDFMGGREGLIEEVINYLIGKEFTTSDIEQEGIEVGGYDFTFKIVDFRIKNYEWNQEVNASFDILKGTVDTFNGEHYDLTDHDLISDELWWELDMEIKDLIKDFLYRILFSFTLDEVNIDLEWG